MGSIKKIFQKKIKRNITCALKVAKKGICFYYIILPFSNLSEVWVWCNLAKASTIKKKYIENGQFLKIIQIIICLENLIVLVNGF